MTAEEQKQKTEKALADKTSYMALAKWHDQEAARYRKKADDCEPISLVGPAPPGNFAGL
jgi:hypothetical protein